MLSSALQKANTAVLLDNANNIEGAMDAYSDACNLLQQAMLRASLEEDRVQLQSIHDTYINRIEQLRALSPRIVSNEKELPARPLTQEFIDEIDSIREEDEFDDDQYYFDEEDASMVYQTSGSNPTSTQRRYQQTPAVVPPRRDSLFIGAVTENSYRNKNVPPLPSKPTATRLNPPSPIAESFTGEDTYERDAEGGRQVMDRESFRFEASSPVRYKVRRSASTGSTSSLVSLQRLSSNLGHSRGGSEVSTSWLNTIDESGGSISGDSVEGREWGRKRGFDAELDAAVEAAYDDDDEYDLEDYGADDLLVMKTSELDVERAKERVRQVEREMQLEIEQDEERRKRLQEQVIEPGFDFFDGNEDDEDEVEERLLEDMTRDYLLDDFEFDLGSKTSLARDPRESSSSSMSASTWVSSIASKKSSLMSHGYASGTPLQSVAELPISRPPSVPPPPPPQQSENPPQLPPKPSVEALSKPTTISTPPSPASPSKTLPSPQVTSAGSPSKGSPGPGLSPMQSGVRSRRLSGLISGPLKIETSPSGLATTTSEISTIPIPQSQSPLHPSGPPPHPPLPPPDSTDAEAIREDGAESSIPTEPDKTDAVSIAASEASVPPPVPLKTAGTVRPFPSPLPVSESGAVLTPMPYPLSAISNEATTPRSGSPARFASKVANLPGLRQISSSSSLKNLNKVSTPDLETSSPVTPSANNLFSSASVTNLRLAKQFAAQVLPSTPGGMIPVTPINYSFSPTGLSSGGLHLFDSKLHSPTTPGSPSALIPNPPVPLEPCPAEPLSRPFWLMRCLYQTIAHPRGGYISARLFVPRDVWQIKGIKIKAVDDKISVCDLVSAALAKLSIIQSGDGNINAIFEEMQSLEGVLDRVQAVLSKKLGNDVGAAGATTLYGSSSNGDGGIGDGKGSTGKSYLSWRKLRSKNSNTALATSFGMETGFETPNFPMATPRTGSDPPPPPPERNLKAVQFSGPNAAYIAALARIFDAAQVLDRLPIAEAEGLPKKTHIGLQLSQRHAAEFFGFYICRFVLADVTLLLDKFLKKGTEWVGS
ncbi:hypothetical protein BDZ91DRAFT_752486 [Kalaharituber pfeilii]|nr:hypothetical protein BDZ91DRAFT_752486 [Kalaharituber pfeilii]